MNRKETEFVLGKLEEIALAINEINNLLSSTILYSEEEKIIISERIEKIKDLTLLSREKADKALECKIKNLITEMGIRYSNAGFNYIVEAVMYVCKNNESSNIRMSVTKEIYPYVSKKVGNKSSNVERAIRHSVGSIFTKGNLNKITKVFPYWDPEKESITNGDFIYGIADFVTR